MSVYIDEINNYPESSITKRALRYGKRWCHLWADSLTELKDFAYGIGLNPSWFQNKPNFPHFDLTPYMRNKALLYGAKQQNLYEWLRSQRDKV